LKAEAGTATTSLSVAARAAQGKGLPMMLAATQKLSPGP